MIKAANGLIRKLISGQDVQQALAARVNSHLETWRALVHAHANGKPVDLAVLEATGNALRLRDTAKSFSADVAAVQQEQAMQAEADKTYARADSLQAREDEAQKELHYYTDNLPRIRQDAQAASWTRVAAARYASEAMHLRRAHPRLWSDAFADEGDTVAKARMAVDEVEPEGEPAIPTPRAPVGSAVSLGASWEE